MDTRYLAVRQQTMSQGGCASNDELTEICGNQFCLVKPPLRRKGWRSIRLGIMSAQTENAV